MSKLYTTKTAALKATTIDGNIIDAKKLMIYPGVGEVTQRKNILELIEETIEGAKIDLYDERGTNKTDKDIWGRSVEMVDGDNMVRCKWLNASIDDITKSSIAQVQYNKALDSTGKLVLNIECNRIKSAINTLATPSLTYFNGDLSNLEVGVSMFENSSISSLTCKLDSLLVGDSMFKGSTITLFNNDMPSLSSAKEMFKNTSKMETFASALDNVFETDAMFENSTITSFSSHVPYLYKATNMFANSSITNVLASFSNLLDGAGMFENTNLTLDSVRIIAETLPKINEHKIEADGSKTFVWANGLTYKHYIPQWSDEVEDTKPVAATLTISPENIGEIMITWKDTSVLSKAEKAIIIYEYFKLMTLKGWTVVTNLYEDKTDEDGNPIVPSGVYYRVANGHTYIATNIHYPENGFKDETKWIHVDSIENIPANIIA